MELIFRAALASKSIFHPFSVIKELFKVDTWNEAAYELLDKISPITVHDDFHFRAFYVMVEFGFGHFRENLEGEEEWNQEASSLWRLFKK